MWEVPSTSFADRIKVYEMVRDAVDGGRFVGATDFIRSNKGCVYAMPSRETIKRWALGGTSPFTGKNLFVARPSEELSFFLGAWLGDGWADENDGGKRMRLKVRSQSFALEFARVASVLLSKSDPYRVWTTSDEGGWWYNVKVTSFTLYKFANQSLDQLKDLILPFPRGFLRGFFTAEGCPSVNVLKWPEPHLNVGVVVSNSDISLMEYCEKSTGRIGLPSWQDQT